MQMDSKTKWNSKYRERIHNQKQTLPNPRLVSLSSYLRGGNALDVACGLGANSQFLAGEGYKVQAVDISDVAINNLQQHAIKNNLNIQARVADLTDELWWLENTFDLVIMTYYLDRELFPLIKKVIKDGGYFFMETYYLSLQTENQGVSDQYKLKSKELFTEFKDWKIIFFEENEQEGWQSIFCQKNLEEYN
jgi:tellurite methyltransferase